jgi:hypothetical protein
MQWVDDSSAVTLSEALQRNAKHEGTLSKLSDRFLPAEK